MPAGDAEQDGTLAREAVVFPTAVHGAAHGAGTADGNKKPRNRGAFFRLVISLAAPCSSSSPRLLKDFLPFARNDGDVFYAPASRAS